MKNIALLSIVLAACTSNSAQLAAEDTSAGFTPKPPPGCRTMPLGRAALTAAERARITAWIDAGAVR